MRITSTDNRRNGLIDMKKKTYNPGLGDRIRVHDYHYKNMDTENETVVALPGETAVVVDACYSGYVVIFDRTGEQGVVPPDSFDDASDGVQVRPL